MRAVCLLTDRSSRSDAIQFKLNIVCHEKSINSFVVGFQILEIRAHQIRQPKPQIS